MNRAAAVVCLAAVMGGLPVVADKFNKGAGDPDAPPIRDIAVSPKDGTVAVTNGQSSVKLYTLTGRLRSIVDLRGHAVAHDLEYSPRGTRLAVSSLDAWGGWAWVLRTSDRARMAKLGLPLSRTTADPAAGIEYADHGRFVVGTTRRGGRLLCWRSDGALYATFLHFTGRTGFRYAVHPKQSLVAVSDTGDKVLRFWDFLDSGRYTAWGRAAPSVPNQTIRQMRFTPDGRSLLLALETTPGQTDFVMLTPGPKGLETRALHSARDFRIRDLEWSPDGRRFYASGLLGRNLRFDLKHGERRFLVRDGSAVRALTLAERGRFVLTGSTDQVIVWDAETLRPLRSWRVPR